MNLLHRLEHWGDTHHSKYLDIVRMALGGFLIFKGIDFLMNMSEMIGLLSTSFSFGYFAFLFVGHFVVFAHIVGGFLIMVGVLTRFACLIQIPILLGAIIFVNTNPEMLRPYSELLLSIMVLLLLMFFLVVGNGPWSMHWLDKDEEEKRSIS